MKPFLSLVLGLCLSTTVAASPLEDLSRESLVHRVLAQNQTVEAARQTWILAETQIAQAHSRKDPILRFGLMPTTLSNDGGAGNVASVSQALEWPGKRKIRGDIASSDARKQLASFEYIQLQLVWQTRQLFESYTTIWEAIDINGQHQIALAELGLSAEAHYTAGHGAQSSPLQVQVEQALLERERIGLYTEVHTVAAQLNGLLHRAPNTPLGQPIRRTLPAELPAPHLEAWQKSNQATHPRLQAKERAIASAQHKISLAHKAKLPDFTVTATTESMPGAERTPLQVGVGLNLPFNQAWRRAQIVGTQSLLSYTQAQYAQTESDLQVEQRQNWLALEAAIAQSTLYRKQIHPAAEQLLAAAEAGYIAGQEDFLVVLLAQRQRFRLQLEHKKVIAESWKAWASLQLATAGIPLPTDLSNTKGGRQ